MKPFYILFSVIVCINALAEEVTQTPEDLSYKHEGKKFPPVLFVTNIEGKDFEEQLESYEAFSRLDKEAIGLPIGVRVLKGHRRKQDGTQFSTLMLSASTLGLIPIVSNTEFKIHYDIFVQGESIETFKYHIDSTDVNNLWTMQGTGRETKPSEELFIEHSINLFLNDLAKSEEAMQIFEEYWEYFEE